MEYALAKVLISEMAGRYCDACDRKDWDAALALFADNADVDASSVYGKTMKGKDEIREFFEGAPPCLGHHATGFYSDITGDTTATGRLKMLTLFKGTNCTVDYDWQLVCDGDTWKIAKQTINVFAQQKLASPSK